MVRLQPHDLFDLRYVRDARLSPDARHVAYAVSSTDSEERFQVLIRNLDDGQERQLAFAGNATTPRWSPDGRQIAFVGDRRLRVTDATSLEVSQPLTPELAVQGAPAWSPDSTRLAVSLLEVRPTSCAQRITRNAFRAEGYGYFESLTQHIYEVNRFGDHLRLLTPAETLCSAPQWSPCGRRILFLAADPAAPFRAYPARLLTVELESGRLEERLHGQWAIGSARWLSDGKEIAIVGARDSPFTAPNLSVWLLDREGATHLRTPMLKADVGLYVQHDMPVWDLSYGLNALALCDDRWAFVTVQNGGSGEVWRIALQGDVQVEPVLTGERSCLVLDVNPTRDILLYAVTTLHAPMELARASLSGADEQRLTALNDPVLARWPRIDSEQLVLASSDGTPIDAWSMRAAGCTPPLPTVLFIHGGPFAATGHAFRYDFFLLASHGFGVVFANFRGSAGYGEAFRRTLLGDWSRSYPDHMATIDAAVDRGLADPQRLCVWGHSYGGYATCWIVGHTDRFRAAIAEAAFTDCATHYYHSDQPAIQATYLGGRPHEIPDLYRACSPMTHAHRCVTPTLLLHGEDDLRCPISEAEQFHRGLRDVGCATELVRIRDCSHVGDSVGPLSARRAQNEALLDWLKRYL